MSKKKKPPESTVCSNRKARHDYHILDTAEAGIVLTGTEIKSLRAHKASLAGSYARVDANGEVWMIGSNIEEYEKGNQFNHDPKRARKLLLHKKEIAKFAEKAQQQGHTLIPLRIYLNKGKAKVELAVAKGKQTHDKRQSLKERDAEREMRRT